MLPLVTTVEEVLASRRMLEEEAAALKAAGIPAADSVPIGVMVETPAAVVIADQLAEVSAFFSVGTNDLTQYTLAVDRGNAHLAGRFSAHHPAVVRQLARVAEVASKAGISASVCGEMASDPLSAVLLIGMGYDTLSVSPQDLALIKWIVRSVPMAAAQEAAAAGLAATTPEKVAEAVRSVVKRYIDMRLLEPGGSIGQ
jgi:phosphotransferase system enzyme I (PtsI)